MTDEYFPGTGHPIAVDQTTGRSDKKIAYDDEIHGYAIVMCSVMNNRQLCINNEVYVKDYAKHLKEVHAVEIDPVQDRLMKSSAMLKPGIRKSKYVWAPFPDEIPRTLYEMHIEEINQEQIGN